MLFLGPAVVEVDTLEGEPLSDCRQSRSTNLGTYAPLLAAHLMPETRTVTAHALDTAGHGVAHVKGWGPVSIPGLAVGSRARVALRKPGARGKAPLGTLVELLESSPDQVQAPCHHAAPLRGTCGGCPLMHLSDAAEHRWRESQLLDGWGERAIPSPVLHAPPTSLTYRNRTHLLAFLSGSGRVRLGSRAPHSEGLAWMRGCRTVTPALQVTIDALELLLQEHEILPADASPDGLARVSARSNRRGQVLLELITRTKAPWIEFLARELVALPNVHVLLAGLKPQEDNTVWSERNACLTPEQTLDEELDGRTYRLDSRTFFQLHTAVAESMCHTLATWVESLPTEERRHAVDLYCGVGVLGHALLQRNLVQSLRGRDAVASSTQEASRAGSTWQAAARWETADLEQPAPDLLEGADLLLVNPPRRGLAQAVKESLRTWNGRHLFYMSCDLRTLCRDMDEMALLGWEPVRAEAWAMLPQTRHTEILVQLRREAA